jgi:O-antigen/teichoic acid export membrane protein
MTVDRAKGLALAERGRRVPLHWNAIINAGGTIAYYGAVVVAAPIAIRWLGEDLWGVWQLVGAVTSYAVLLNLGLSSAVSYDVSRGVARQDLELLGVSINNARIYLGSVGLLLLILLMAIGPRLVTSLVEPALYELGLTALILSVGLTAASLPVRLFLSVVSGLQRYDLLSISRIASGLLLVLCVAVGFPLGMGLAGFVVVMTLAPALPALVAWLATRRILPSQCFRWRRLDLPSLNGMIRYSLSTLIYTTGTVVLFQSMKLIAAWRCGGAAAAGHMGLVVNIAQVLAVVFIPLSGVIHTRVSDLHNRGLDHQLPELLRRSLQATGLVAVPTVLFLVLEAETVFDAWVGNALKAHVIHEMSRTLRFMMSGQGLYVMFLPCFYGLLGLGRHRVFGLGMLGAGVVNAVLGWYASGIDPRLEALGLTFGATLAILVLVVVVPSALRQFGLRVSTVLRESVVVPVLLVLPGAAALWWRPELQDPKLDLLLAAGFFGVFCLPGMWLGRRRLSASPEPTGGNRQDSG